MRRAVKVVLLAALVCAIAILSIAQANAPSATSASAKSAGPAESLYQKLQSVGLDKAHVYKVREASIDRAKMHISLDDGTIAFTEAVDGRITGAFFEGYGEVLLIPPTQTERASMSLFTGGAILEEAFSTAYFRFNDDLLAELQPYLRPADDPKAFASKWDETARNMAPTDALRLLLSFFRSGDDAKLSSYPPDHMLHAYIEGNKLGGFDMRYDSLLPEQVEAGQHKHSKGEDFYDVWASFAVPLSENSNGSSGLSESSEAPNTELDVTSFKIQARIQPAKELEAKATLSITAQQTTRRVLLFELSRMLRVSQVLADGRPVEFIHNQAIEGSHLARQGNDVIAVVLPNPIEKGHKLELSFQYAGSVLSEAANGLLYVGDRGTWYPNVGFARASYDLQFEYPAGWTLVSVGHRTEAKNEGAEQSSHWVSSRPIPIAGFNLGKYSSVTNQVGKVEITTYATPNVERGFPGTASLADSQPPVLPGVTPTSPRALRPFSIKPLPPPPSPSGNTRMVSGISAQAIEFYEQYFGPYPYRGLSITQLPGPLSQGWPGLIFLSSYSFLTPDEKAKVQGNPVRRLISNQVIAHETAHQWWGDLVNWNTYRDQWIVEGLANYSALMLLESHDPAGFHQVMQTYRDDLMAKNDQGMALMEAGPVTLGFRLSSSKFPSAYDTVGYGRGTWLFHMLRTMMSDGLATKGSTSSRGRLGDEPFLRALRKLRTQYEDKAVSTADLMHVFESELPPSLWYEGHRSLDWFNEAWVNGSAIPSIELRDVKFSEKAKTTAITGTIVQKDAPDTLVTAVPIYASARGRNLFLKRVFAEGDETQFRLIAPAGIRRLVIDPEHTLLTRAK
jgi:peptidase M1-like protein